jgi:hypothetical protein
MAHPSSGYRKEALAVSKAGFGIQDSGFRIISSSTTAIIPAP